MSKIRTPRTKRNGHEQLSFDYVPDVDPAVIKKQRSARKSVPGRGQTKSQPYEILATYRTLYETTNDIIYTHDLEWNILSVNPAIERILGYDTEELIGKNILTAVRSDLIPDIKSQLETKLKNPDTKKPIELIMRTKDGREKWFEINAVLLYSPEGIPCAVQGIAPDINDRKQAERELLISEQKYRAIFENTNAAMGIIEEDNILSLVNDEFEKMTGYAKEEVEGKKMWMSFVDADDLDRMMGYHTSRMKGGDAPRNYEFRFICKNGKKKHVYITVAFIDGARQRVISMTDLTERDVAEESLKESEARYRTFLDATSDGVYLKDENFRYLFANRVFLKENGLREEADILGKVDDDVLIPDFLEVAGPSDRMALQAGRLVVVEEQGGSHFTEVRKFPVALPNGKTGIGAIIRDITETRQAEEEKKRLEVRVAERTSQLEAQIEEQMKVERALAESEEKFRNFMESAPIGICVADLSGRIQYINRRIEEESGWTRDELLSRDAFAAGFFDEETTHLLLERLAARLGGDEPRVTEVPIMRRDGSRLWADLKTTILYKDGLPSGLQIAFIDITERREAEEALAESERKYRLVAEKITDIVWILDMNLRTVYVSPSVEAVLGFTPEERLTQDVTEQLTPSSLSVALEAMGKELALEQQGQSNPERNMTIELEYYHKDGSIRWIENIVSGIRDDQGVLTGFHGVSRDITARKQMEDALKENEVILKSYLDNAPDGIYMSDLQGTFLYGNHRSEEITGYQRDELIGKNFLEVNIIPEGSVGKAMRLLDASIEGKPTGPNEIELIQKDGRRMPVEINTSVVQRKGENIVLGFVRDIKERKDAEKEKKKLERALERARKMEALGTLAGGIAHDLNNVLGGIVSLPELLLMKLSDNDPMKRQLELIKRSGEKAARIVQDMLTLTRRGVTNAAVLSLNDIISLYFETPEHDKLQFFHPDVRFEMQLDDQLPNIVGSSVHLSKTVMNLLSNAAEAMPKGGTVTVKTENRYIDKPVRGYDDIREGDYAVLMVADTGGGIPPEDIERIFEPFFTKKVMGRSGTGLGMTVVWGTVQDHNGYIDVQSEVDKGTTFTLYFPATKKKVKKEKEHVPIEQYLGNEQAILIVDDVPDQLELASSMLSRLGYKIVTASSGEKALEYLQSHSVDLVLLDMIMDPGIDGLETYRRILDIHPGQKAIIASGYVEKIRIQEAQRLGVGTFIKKPYMLEEIGIAIRKELAK